MIVFELLFAALIALVLGGLLVLGLGREPFAGRDLALYLVLFLATWAGGIWLAPIGPPLWGVHVLSFLAGGVLIALVLAASSTPRTPRTRDEELRRSRAEREIIRTLDISFWLLVALLAASIAYRYL